MRAAVSEARKRLAMRTMATPRFEFRRANLEAQTNHDRELILSGPAGTGKSLANLTYINAAMWRHPRLRVLCVRKVRADLAESILVTYERDVLGYDNPIAAGQKRQSRDVYTYPNGSVMVIGGMDRPGRFLSSEWDIIYAPECQQLTLDEWEMLVQRKARDGKYPYPQIRGDVNPDRPDHWIIQRSNDGALTLLSTTHQDNPKYWSLEADDWTPLGREYVLGTLSSLTGVRRERYLLGRWVSAEGAIYPDFDPTLHVIDRFEIPADWARYRVIDFGFTNPFVCYDDQTEVLTQKGWVNFALLRKGDIVATVNMASHKMEWQTPSAYIEQWYEGPMVLSEPDEQGANFCVTPNHRMVIANRKSGKWRLHAADLLKQVGDSAIPTGWNPRDAIDGDERVWRERVNRMGRKSTLDAKRVDFARFLGLWLSEGCLSEQAVKSINQTRRYVRIAQKHDTDAVRAILSTLGVTWQETTGKNGVIDFRIQHAALFDELNELCGKVLSADKRIPAAVWEWGVDSLHALLDGLMLGDGRHRTHDESGKRIATDAYYTTSKSLADDVQTLACHLGAPSVISSQRRTTPYAPNGLTVHIVRFHRARQAKIDKLPLKAVPYSGFVRCVTVPNGTLIVRRGGRPMVCGNCQWWAVDGDGRLYMYREIYKTQTLVEDHARLINDLSAGERYVTTIRDHDAEDGATLERYGIDTTPADKDVSTGIQSVAARLRDAGDGKPRVFFMRDALVEVDSTLADRKRPTRTVEEFGGYVWNDRVKREEPLKQDDHGMDALRYLCKELDIDRRVTAWADNPLFG